jgi:acetyl-CoA carboxylase biotin carboxylase subunit
VHKPNRRQALAALERSLDEFTVTGIQTTIPFYRRILSHSGFAAGHYDTGFVEDFLVGSGE